MGAFLAAIGAILAIMAIAAIAKEISMADGTFIKDYQTLFISVGAICAAGIAFAGVVFQTSRNAKAAREQMDREFKYRHDQQDASRRSLIAAIQAEIKAVRLGIVRRGYIELCQEKLEKLKEDATTHLPEFGFSQNYMPVLDAAAGRIGELPPDIAEGVARVGVLAKSSMDQANLIHQTGLRDQPPDPTDPSAKPSPISGEYKIGLMNLLLEDARALTAAIDDILPKLEAHLAAMPVSAEPTKKPD